MEVWPHRQECLTKDTPGNESIHKDCSGSESETALKGFRAVKPAGDKQILDSVD